MTFHKTALILWGFSFLLTSCAENAPLPVSTSTLRPEATTSPLASQSPTQELSSQIENSIAISPDGLYGIACQFPELVLFNVKSGDDISKLNLGYSVCQRNIRWSPDSLYAILIDQQGVIYQWPVDGSQPVELNTNIDIPPSRFTGHTQIIPAWSPDGNYLAIFKECNIYIRRYR